MTQQKYLYLGSLDFATLHTNKYLQYLEGILNNSSM